MKNLTKKQVLLIIWIVACSIIFLAFTVLLIYSTVAALRAGSPSLAGDLATNIVFVVVMAIPYVSFIILAIQKLKSLNAG